MWDCVEKWVQVLKKKKLDIKIDITLKKKFECLGIFVYMTRRFSTSTQKNFMIIISNESSLNINDA